MDKMKLIHITGAAVALAASIPTFMVGNVIMGVALVIVGGVILYINLQKKD